MTQKTQKTQKTNSKTDEEVLFPSAKIGKYTIKPWSFGILFDISVKLETVLDRLREKDIEGLFDLDLVSPISIARLFTVASSEVLSIIAITLDVDEDEVRNLSMEDGIRMAYVIYRQNATVIKNALAPLLALITVTEEGETSEMENQEESKDEQETEEK